MLKRKYSSQRVSKTTKRRRLTRGPISPRRMTREKKFYDQTINMVATEIIHGSPFFLCLNDPIQGTDIFNRIGRKITNVSIQWRLYIVSTDAYTMLTDSAPPICGRMMIFVDKQPNGALPSLGDLLQNTTSQLSTTSPINYNNRDRFSVLKDTHFVLDPYLVSAIATQSVATTGRQATYLKGWIPLNLETQFNGGSTATIADLTTGALNAVFMCNNTVANDGYKIFGIFRLRYFDD